MGQESRNGWCPLHATECGPKEICPLCYRSVNETDRWWQAFCGGVGIMALDFDQKTPYPKEVAVLSAEFADAAIAEAKKRGRI